MIHLCEPKSIAIIKIIKNHSTNCSEVKKKEKLFYHNSLFSHADLLFC